MEKATDHADSASRILHALEVAARAVGQVGSHRVELVTIARGWVCMQPAHLADGAAIAGELQLPLPLDHRMMTPGYTVWSGDREGLDVQVRAELRRPAGVLL